jgi:hypothetical protein
VKSNRYGAVRRRPPPARCIGVIRGHETGVRKFPMAISTQNELKLASSKHITIK